LSARALVQTCALRASVAPLTIEGTMSKARHQLPNQGSHPRFAKSDDDVSFQRDVRVKRIYRPRDFRRSQSI
jgi:hypothetical protein